MAQKSSGGKGSQQKKKKTSAEALSLGVPGRNTSAKKSSSSKSGAQTKKSAAKSPSSGSASTKKPTSKSASSKSAASKSSSAKKTAPKTAPAKTGKSASAASRSSGTTARSAPKTAPRSAPKPSPKPQNTRPSGGSSAKKSRESERPMTELDRKRSTPAERQLYDSPEAAEIRQRRAYRKYSTRRTNSALFYVVISVAVIVAVAVMSLTVLFKITEVKVELGENVPYSEDVVMMYSSVKTGQNLFTADVAGTEESIMNALPYIEKCTVRRKLPSTIIIETEAARLAGTVMTETGQRIAVSTSGRALELVSPGQVIDAPELDGLVVTGVTVGETIVTDDGRFLECASMIVDGFREQGLGLDSLAVDSHGKISAMYDGRVEIVFGDESSLDKKIALAAGFLTGDFMTQNEAGRLDVTRVEKAYFTPDYVLKTIEDKISALDGQDADDTDKKQSSDEAGEKSGDEQEPDGADDADDSDE